MRHRILRTPQEGLLVADITRHRSDQIRAGEHAFDKTKGAL
jgi:hypothetical protein